MFNVVDTKDPTAVQVEVQRIYRAMFPSGDRFFVPKVFGWAIDCFTGLKDFSVAAVADRRWVKAQHRVEGQLRRFHLPAEHAHPPIRHLEFVATPRSALMVEHAKHNSILHEVPAWRLHWHGHVHVHRLLILCAGFGHRYRQPYRNRQRDSRKLSEHCVLRVKIGVVRGFSRASGEPQGPHRGSWKLVPAPCGLTRRNLESQRSGGRLGDRVAEGFSRW